MEAGTGKTLTACTLIESRKDIESVLWFTPCQTKKNLQKELEKIKFKVPTEIMGIETLSNSGKTYLYLLEKYKNKKFFCVLDESLKIKNYSKRAKRIMDIGDFAKYRICLNGTPISKNYLDLYNQMEFLSPKILKMNFWEYYNTFVEETRVKKGRKLVRKYISGYENLDYLFKLIKPFIFESKLRLDVEKEYNTIYFNIDDVSEEYDKLKEKMLKELEEWGTVSFLGYSQQMQHTYSICEDKIKELDKLLKKTDPAKTLIYCKFIDEQEYLKNKYPELNIMSLQKHSLGLNLQEFNTLIFFNRTFDYALMEQAERRIYRTGQTQKCTFYELVGACGLERLITKNLDKKSSLLDDFKNKTIRELEEIL